MGKRQSKAAITGCFVLSAGLFYLSDIDGVRAQHAVKNEERSAVLASVTNYKAWQLVSKPAPARPSDTFRITDSAVAG